MLLFVANITDKKLPILRKLNEVWDDEEVVLVADKNEKHPMGFSKILSWEFRTRRNHQNITLKKLFAFGKLSRISRRQIVTSAEISKLRFGGSLLGWLNHHTSTYIALFELLKDAGESRAIVWTQFTPESRVFSSACNDSGIHVAFMEYGFLDGTITLSDSQVGAHWAPRNPAVFQKIQITHQDQLKADKVIELISSRASHILNATFQNSPENTAISAVKTKILYLANNHPYSGVIDRDKKSSWFQSRGLSGDNEALSKILEKLPSLNFELKYRSHPSWTRLPTVPHPGVTYSQPNSRESVLDDIIAADMVATINSTSIFYALVIGKPVLLMGGNQFSNSNLSFETEGKKDIGLRLEQAMKFAKTNNYDRQALVRFVSRWLKTEVYSYGLELEKIGLNDFGVLVKDLDDWGKTGDKSFDQSKLRRVGVPIKT